MLEVIGRHYAGRCIFVDLRLLTRLRAMEAEQGVVIMCRDRRGISRHRSGVFGDRFRCCCPAPPPLQELEGVPVLRGFVWLLECTNRHRSGVFGDRFRCCCPAPPHSQKLEGVPVLRGFVWDHRFYHGTASLD
ncbi:MAG: hypothetical protein WAN99_09260, partial [Methanoculleus sp.]